jgi:site-specific DNA recombinase
MLKYFIYARKSSEDEDRQILSIEAQLSELNALARGSALHIAQTFTESKSAKEPGRILWNDMLRRIEAGEANAILSWKLDRLARNFDDGGKIIGLLQRGVIQEIRTFERTYLPSDNVLMIAVELGMANQYVRDLSVNIRRGIREKVRRGIFSGRAPLGYINDPRTRTIEPHPELFPKVKRVLELFSTGEYSVTAIQRETTRLGLMGRQNGRPLRLSSIGHLLRCPFYYGVFLHKEEVHQGVHVPMITKKTYDDIQAALIAVAKPRKQRGAKGLLFLNFATCGSCGHCITGERHIKKSGLRFFYYRCTHKNKKIHCEDRSFVRPEKFAEEVRRNTQLVALSNEWKERFLARVETWESEVSTTKTEQIDRLKAELAAIKSKIDRINNGFADGSLDITEFKELKNPLVPKKVELEQQIAALEKSRANRLEPLRNWILEAHQHEQHLADQNWLEMKALLTKVGSNRLLHAQTLTVAFKTPWNYLAQTTVAVQSTDDISLQSSRWWRRWELNPRPLQSNRE